MAIGCKEKYELPFSSPDTGYLVVEGIICNALLTTNIALSRTNKLSASSKQPESGAKVQVEGNDNSIFSLLETGVGGYTANLNLSNNKKYRLRIKTASGKEYLSDFVEVKITPPIDSISWERESNGVQLYINTYDKQNNTRYYQWDYEETWEFHSAYKPVLTYVKTLSGVNGIGFKDTITRMYDTSIYKCWRSASSNLLTIGTSAKLSKDIIFKPLLFIPSKDRKLSVLYSINLRQYALTKAGYEFLEKMKKNTEGTGSIFDPQPSQLQGNIYCLTDSKEPVIGFISISTLEQKRLFINKSEVPFWGYESNCEEKSILNDPDSIQVAMSSGKIPTVILKSAGPIITRFGTSTAACIDCRLSGTNVKPLFWP